MSLLLHCQLWDINMDSGPVATFQVHEYLRPKVRFLSLEKSKPAFLLLGAYAYYNFSFLVCSCVIYMKMIQSLINLSVA